MMLSSLSMSETPSLSTTTPNASRPSVFVAATVTTYGSADTPNLAQTGWPSPRVGCKARPFTGSCRPWQPRHPVSARSDETGHP
eukprot:2496643-Rhodomonas_salina.1